VHPLFDYYCFDEAIAYMDSITEGASPQFEMCYIDQITDQGEKP